MTDTLDGIARKNKRELQERLGVLGEIKGVRDYLLVGGEGQILARNPESGWSEKAAAECARDMALAGQVLSLLSKEEGEERVFGFHFEHSFLIGWDLGSAYLVALCREEASLAIVRMTVNVIKEELRRSKRFRPYMAERVVEDADILDEKHVQSEMYKHVVALKQKSPVL